MRPSVPTKQNKTKQKNKSYFEKVQQQPINLLHVIPDQNYINVQTNKWTGQADNLKNN